MSRPTNLSRCQHELCMGADKFYAAEIERKRHLKHHYEIVNARTYYGRHATGIVVLRDGQPELHGKRKDLKSSKLYQKALAYELSPEIA